MTAKRNTADLSEQTAAKLLTEIRSGRYRTASRLPSENEIAAGLGVSRTVVRDALAALEMKGYIGRKRGLGTVVNRHVLALKTRVDLEDEFMTMIAQAGFHPGMGKTVVRTVRAEPEIMRRLLVSSSEELFAVEKLVTADGTPAVFCVDYIPKGLIKSEEYGEEEMEAPIFRFLEQRCDEQVAMGLSELHAVKADRTLAKKLRVAEGDPVLQLKETRYNFDGIPVLYSDEYYREGVLTQTILRKNIGKWWNDGAGMTCEPAARGGAENAQRS